eukprot:4581142-Lingulodinium_polyedra.AAC.1
MATDAGYALRGVPAGCTFATYSIQCYCMADIDTFMNRWPRLSLSIFIDDFVGAMARDKRRLRRHVSML